MSEEQLAALGGFTVFVLGILVLLLLGNTVGALGFVVATGQPAWLWLLSLNALLVLMMAAVQINWRAAQRAAKRRTGRFGREGETE